MAGDGAAAKAGLQAGDMVTKINDFATTTADGLIAATRFYAPGTEISVTYTRDGGAPQTVKVTLGHAVTRVTDPGTPSSTGSTSVGRFGASARAALDAFHVQDGDRTGFEPDPAAGGEIGQGLVDRLAGGADQLGQLLLGEVMVHVYAVVALVAEPLGELEQLLGHPPGHVGEDQVGDHVVGPAQPRRRAGRAGSGPPRDGRSASP